MAFKKPKPTVSLATLFLTVACVLVIILSLGIICLSLEKEELKVHIIGLEKKIDNLQSSLLEASVEKAKGSTNTSKNTVATNTAKNSNTATSNTVPTPSSTPSPSPTVTPTPTSTPAPTTVQTEKNTSELNLNAAEYKNWKLSTNTSNNILFTLNKNEKDNQVSSIIVYKDIDSTSITDINDYISKHKYQVNPIGGTMEFNKEISINSNNWLIFNQKIQGTISYDYTIYAVNSNNKLRIVEINTSDVTSNESKTEIDSIISKIQTNWNIDKDENLNIVIK